MIIVYVVLAILCSIGWAVGPRSIRTGRPMISLLFALVLFGSGLAGAIYDWAFDPFGHATRENEKWEAVGFFTSAYLALILGFLEATIVLAIRWRRRTVVHQKEEI